jgi:hypothetical protein
MATAKKNTGRNATVDEPLDAAEAEPQASPTCGIVMPLSAIDSCSESHWSDVREILNEAIDSAGFEPQLVSDADDVGIIQKRIIQNLYENPIVVCDVSAKNPNVMFELGLRLAFDKPTVIVKDDKTTYSFDTAPIEHLQYPRDLRFGQIVDFKEQLAEKLRGTYRKATEDPAYTTFLKHFGSFTVAKLDTKTVSTEEFILDEIRNLRQMVARIGAKTQIGEPPGTPIAARKMLCFREPTMGPDAIAAALAPILGDEIRFLKTSGDNHIHVALPDYDIAELKAVVRVCRAFAKSARMLPTRG